jgi:ABC-type dipeptide/oligopeptide/nickel transport system permease component
MLRFLAKRVLQGTITVAFIAVVVFGLSRLTGDPLDFLIPIDATPELAAQIAQAHGLDRPVTEQFGIFVADAVRGDLGVSFRYRRPVSEIFLEFFPNSVRLIIPAFILAFAAGVPLGVLSATARSRSLRSLIDSYGIVGISAPPFWVGIVLILILSVWLGLLPSARMGGPANYVMPVTALGFFLAAGVLRLVRSSVLDALDSDYVTLARVKGLSERRIIWTHVLRNSLSAAVSFGAVYFAIMVTGSIVIEKVFAWPGAGRLLYDSILNRDFPVVQGIVILGGVLILAINILLDVLYAMLDPRVRVQS